MTGLAEWLAGRIYALRITSWQQWVLRLLMLAAGAGAAAVSYPWVAVVVTRPWLGLMVVLLLAAVIWPDSVMPLTVVGLLALTWMGGGAEGPWWRALAVVALTALFHLLASYAALAPTFASVTARGAGRMAVAAAAFLGISLAAAALVLVSGYV